MSNRRYRKIEAETIAPRFAPGIARAGAILANEMHAENARLAEPMPLFTAPQLTPWQALRGFVRESGALRLALAILAALAALAILALLTSCSSDPVARQIIERQADYWSQDHRPELADVDYLALPQGQRFYFMPASLAAARRIALQAGKDYAKE